MCVRFRMLKNYNKLSARIAQSGGRLTEDPARDGSHPKMFLLIV